MNKLLRNTLAFFTIPTLTACAALQIDVDVYKGPLSEEEDVQLEQLISLSMTSQRLLQGLQQQLLKDIRVVTTDNNTCNGPEVLTGKIMGSLTIANSLEAEFEADIKVENCNTQTKAATLSEGSDNDMIIGCTNGGRSCNPSSSGYRTMHHKRFSNRPRGTNYREVTYGHLNERICEGLREKNLIIERSVKNKESLVARLSMACNLESMLALFDDDTDESAMNAFLSKAQDHVDRINELAAQWHVKKDQAPNNKSSVQVTINQQIRKTVDLAITDILTFMSRLEADPTIKFDKSEITNDLAKILSELINPWMLDVAQKNLNESIFKFEVNENNQFRANKVEFYLSYQPDKVKQLLSLRRKLKANCFTDDFPEAFTDEGLKARLCSTGFARGITVHSQGPTDSTNQADFDKNQLKEIINKYFQNGIQKLSAKSLNADRHFKGIENLAREAKYGSEESKGKNKELLYSMLLNYAGKLMVLADKQVLLDNHFHGDQASSNQYVQVLQSLGSAVVVQINDIKARERHHRDFKEMQDLDSVLARHHFSLSLPNYINKLRTNLSNQKVSATQQKNALEQAQQNLEEWHELFNKLTATETLNKQYESLEKAYRTLNSIADKKELNDDRTDLKIYKTTLLELFKEHQETKDCALCPATDQDATYDAFEDIKNKLKDSFFNPDSKATTFADYSKNLKQQLGKNLEVFSKKYAQSSTELATLKENNSKNIKTLNALIGSKAEACITSKICEKIDTNIKEQELSITNLQDAVKVVDTVSGTLSSTDGVDKWTTAFSSPDADVNTYLNIAKQSISKTLLPYEFKCPRDGESDSGTANSSPEKHCSPDHIMKGVVRHLESLQISLQVDGNKEELANVKKALTQAYDLTARRQYLIPTSAYLRSSYPSSALQENNSASDWQNMLQRGALQSIPLIGNNFANESEVQQQVDKQYWQNINTVRLTGGGNTNYVVVKDDIGNWYVKGYSADPEKIYNSMANIAITNAAAGAGFFINNSEGAISFKSSGNVLDAMYGRFYEKYSNETTSQFDTLTKWINEESWEDYLDKSCVQTLTSTPAKSIEELAGDENLGTFTGTLENYQTSLKSIEQLTSDKATSAKAKAINNIIRDVALLANQLMKESLRVCKQPEPTDNKSAVIIGDDLYDNFVKTHYEKRQKVLSEFKQNIMFIREGLPAQEQVSPVTLQ